MHTGPSLHLVAWLTGTLLLAAVAWVTGTLLLTAGARAADGKSFQAGAYCPLPEKGEVPKCLEPAQETYSDFFTALDDETAGDEALASVEQAVARGVEEERAYLALSSLTYGYYRLAQRAAVAEAADPETTQRLARWNDLLALAYSNSAEDASYRAAVRQAAEELHARTQVTVPCRDPKGEPADCSSTENVLRGFNAASERVGIRGALERLLQRMLGDES